MKITSIVSFYLLFINFSIAQTTPPCDTIVLKTGEILSVSIDMVSHGEIYYRDCPVDSFVQHKIGLALVEKTYGHQMTADSLLSQLTAELDKEKYELSAFKKWLFKKKAKKVIRSLTERQRVKVTYRHTEGRVGTKTLKGVFVNMTDDEFVLETRKAALIKLKKDRIDKISLYKSKGTTEKVLGGVAIGVGVFVGVIVLAILAVLGLIYVLIAGLGGEPDNDGSGNLGGGCLLATLLIVGGVALLASTGPKGINDPFGGDWEITDNFQQSDSIKADEIKGDTP
ncbi:MAG: hypothetical protein ACI81W_002038 [Saprospiraceae bacterium]|jgi:hypothetical protein